MVTCLSVSQACSFLQVEKYQMEPEAQSKTTKPGPARPLFRARAHRTQQQDYPKEFTGIHGSAQVQQDRIWAWACSGSMGPEITVPKIECMREFIQIQFFRSCSAVWSELIQLNWIHWTVQIFGCKVRRFENDPWLIFQLNKSMISMLRKKIPSICRRLASM